VIGLLRKKSKGPSIVVIADSVKWDEKKDGRRYTQFLPYLGHPDLPFLYTLLMNHISPNPLAEYQKFIEEIKHQQQIHNALGLDSWVNYLVQKVFQEPFNPLHGLALYGNLQQITQNPDLEIPQTEKMMAEGYVRLIENFNRKLEEIPNQLRMWNIHSQYSHPLWAKVLALHLQLEWEKNPNDGDVKVLVSRGMYGQLPRELKKLGLPVRRE